MAEAGRSRAPARPEPGPDPSPASPCRPRRTGGVAVVAGGLLPDLEERLRRDLAPIEERVRPGAETRGLAGGAGRTGADAGDPLVIVLPPAAPASERDVGEPVGH